MAADHPIETSIFALSVSYHALRAPVGARRHRALVAACGRAR
jgi:hypothetical protein